MAKLTQLDHTSLCVGDIDKAEWFYGELLGLDQIPRPDFGFPGAWFQAGTIPLHLTTGGDMPGGEQLRPQNGHLAFLTDNFDEMLQQLAEAEIDWYELPNSPSALRQVFFRDPWGNMIELTIYEED